MSTPDSVSKTPASMEVLVDRAEAYTRAKPAKALSAAFGLGIIMALFPVGRLVGLVFRLVLALLRPVLLILGVVRLFEEYSVRTRGESGSADRS